MIEYVQSVCDTGCSKIFLLWLQHEGVVNHILSNGLLLDSLLEVVWHDGVHTATCVDYHPFCGIVSIVDHLYPSLCPGITFAAAYCVIAPSLLVSWYTMWSNAMKKSYKKSRTDTGDVVKPRRYNIMYFKVSMNISCAHIRLEGEPMSRMT